jgi:hypothetical protein
MADWADVAEGIMDMGEAKAEKDSPVGANGAVPIVPIVLIPGMAVGNPVPVAPPGIGN